ncbi:MAG TPA: DinB family protein [Ignavibacteria bacterium]|nr:DinB family protein [Ignavibacteria bacterium]
MELIKWVDRKFDFSFPAGVFPAILERLSGTPVRLEKILEGIEKDVLIKRYGTNWSIQEHAGHLLDLDAIHEKRLNQYIANMTILLPADITNKKTYLAEHNSKDIKDILNEFHKARNAFVNKAAGVDEIIITRTAIHSRLNKEMRFVDMLYFTAEHDDHHLAVIRNLLNRN